MAGCCPTSPSDGSKSSPFQLKRGLTFTVEATFRDADGRPINLSSPARTGRGSLRGNLTEASSIPVAASFTVTATDAVRGVAEASLGATVTAALATGLYVADIEFENDVDPDDVIGSDVFWIQVTGEVTR